MLKNERVVVLSGKQSHAILTKNLKSLGFYVILIDKYETSFAKEFADEHILVDPFDYDAVKKVVEAKRPDRIVTIAIEKTFRVASRISQEFGMPFPYTFDDILNFTEKNRMKSIFSSKDIPSARHQIVSSFDDFSSNLGLPLVVKPVDSCGSQGVSKVDSSADLKTAIDYAISKSISGKAVVEEFVSGDEVQVDCFVQNGQAHVIMAKEKLKFEKDVISSQVGSLTHPTSSLDDYSQYQRVAEQIAEAFHITDGIFFYQAISHSGKLSVIEIGVRLGGGWSYKMIKLITGFDYPLAAMNAQLGIPTQMNQHLPQKYYLTNFFFSKPCVFDHIEGVESLKKDGVIDDYEVIKPQGSVMDGTLSNPNRIAIYMISADTKDELLCKMKTAIDSVDIIDVDGNGQMNKSIYYSFIERMKR